MVTRLVKTDTPTENTLVPHFLGRERTHSFGVSRWLGTSSRQACTPFFFFVTHCTEPRKTARSGCIAPFVPCALVSHKPALHRSCNTAYWSRYFFILDCAGNCRFLAYTWSLLWNLVMEALFSICVRAIRVLCDMVNHVGRFRHDHAKNS